MKLVVLEERGISNYKQQKSQETGASALRKQSILIVRL